MIAKRKQGTLEPASEQQEYRVRWEDLPLSCPTAAMQVWNAHPRVYVPVHRSGREMCEYCGAVYVLEDPDPDQPMPVNFTISNTTNRDVRLAVVGPKRGCRRSIQWRFVRQASARWSVRNVSAHCSASPRPQKRIGSGVRRRAMLTRRMASDSASVPSWSPVMRTTSK